MVDSNEGCIVGEEGEEERMSGYVVKNGESLL